MEVIFLRGTEPSPRVRAAGAVLGGKKTNPPSRSLQPHEGGGVFTCHS